METLDVYDGSTAFLKELELGGDELTKVRRGTSPPRIHQYPRGVALRPVNVFI